MEIPKIYLETTMFSFYYGQETTPEYRQYKAEARAVFDLIKAGEFEAYTGRRGPYCHYNRQWLRFYSEFEFFAYSPDMDN